jgi:hypothetical protein
MQRLTKDALKQYSVSLLGYRYMIYKLEKKGGLVAYLVMQAVQPDYQPQMQEIRFES